MAEEDKRYNGQAEEDKRYSGQAEGSGKVVSGRPDGRLRRSAGWNAEEENPFRHRAGIRKFRELYTGKRRRDRAAWADYFVSDEFLEGYREEKFAVLLLETVREYQADCPPGKEFLTELCIAYGLQVSKNADGLQVQMQNNASFYGLDQLCAILQTGGQAVRFKENDTAMLAGFQDYRELLQLAFSDWDDDALLRMGKIIDCYTLSNLSDRPMQTGRYEQSWRHPKSVKLITYFFVSQQLPERVYQVPWNHLRLENATLGKEKLFYGRLRETVLAHAPKLGEKPRASYRELLREFYAYDTSSGYYSNAGKTPEEQREMDAFFQRKDVQDALNDAAFVEGQVLHYWITRGSGAYLLKKLQEYYAGHREAPFAERILQQIGQVMEYRKVDAEYQEDEQAEVIKGGFDLRRRAYARYYFNTAFHLAKGIRHSILLTQYLDEKLPYSPGWSARLSDPGESGISSVHPIQIDFGEHVLQIFFCPKYIAYRWDGSTRVPVFPGERLADIGDETIFWLLVPIASAPYDSHPQIYAELMRRLAALPVGREDIPVIADCITGRICRMEEHPAQVCSFQEEPLREPANDRPEKTEMELLPVSVLIKNLWNVPGELNEDAITEERVREVLNRYFDGELNRVELAWGGRSLLFLKDGEKYACFFFDHQKQDWYAVVAMPEVYQTVESDDVIYEPFGFGMLPNYLIHPNTARIAGYLDEILAQTACRQPCPGGMRLWSPQIYRFEMRQRYRLAKVQFGGYPAEQAQNQILDRFYIPELPVSLCFTDLQGNASGKKAVLKNKAALQQVLNDYMAGRLQKLVLIWQYETGTAYEGTLCQKRSILLVQDQGNHRMTYLDEGKKGMDCLVSDVQEYMNAEGKRYRKAEFEGKTVPGYLVHTDLRRIRDFLDFLIPQMGSAKVSLGGFGEFSYESKEAYECVRKALQLLDEEKDTPL